MHFIDLFLPRKQPIVSLLSAVEQASVQLVVAISCMSPSYNTAQAMRSRGSLLNEWIGCTAVPLMGSRVAGGCMAGSGRMTDDDRRVWCLIRDWFLIRVWTQNLGELMA